MTTFLLGFFRFNRMRQGAESGRRMNPTQMHQLSQEVQQTFIHAELCMHTVLWGDSHCGRMSESSERTSDLSYLRWVPEWGMWIWNIRNLKNFCLLRQKFLWRDTRRLIIDFSKRFILLFFNFVSVCVCAGEGLRLEASNPHGTGVTGSWELPRMGAENRTQILCKNNVF